MGCIDWDWVESNMEVQGNRYFGEIRGMRWGMKPSLGTKLLYQIMG